jgi:uncharacterized protein YheU (UPF0270 family)
MIEIAEPWTNCNRISKRSFSNFTTTPLTEKKSPYYVSSSEKVDDIKVPVKTVESNALDDLLDSVVSPSSHEDQGPVKTVESNALDELLDSVVLPSSHEVHDISNHSVTDKSWW